MYTCYVAIVTIYGMKKADLKNQSKESNSKTEKGRAFFVRETVVPSYTLLQSFIKTYCIVT